MDKPKYECYTLDELKKEIPDLGRLLSISRSEPPILIIEAMAKFGESKGLEFVQWFPSGHIIFKKSIPPILVLYINSESRSKSKTLELLKNVDIFLQRKFPDFNSVVLASNETRLVCLNPQTLSYTEYQNLLEQIQKQTLELAKLSSEK